MQNLKTEEGRIAAIKQLEDSFLYSLRINGLEIAKDSVCNISETKITLAIEADAEYKNKGYKIAFASEVDIYSNLPLLFFEGENGINFASSGQFTPKIRACYWRTIHAAEILKNWDLVCKIVNEHCQQYRDLVISINQENQTS